MCPRAVPVASPWSLPSDGMIAAISGPGFFHRTHKRQRPQCEAAGAFETREAIPRQTNHCKIWYAESERKTQALCGSPSFIKNEGTITWPQQLHSSSETRVTGH
jgi:hypothetical protein